MTLTPDQRRVLGQALVQLAGPAGPLERAQLLAVTAGDVFGTGTEVVILAREPSRDSAPAVEAVAGSDDGCRALAELERRTGHGPALASARSGGPLTLEIAEEDHAGANGPDIGATAWGRAAARLGWRRLRAVPLISGGPAVGGLVLLDRAAEAGAGPDPVWAQTLAGVAAAGLLQSRALAHARTVTEQLEHALESRVAIEQAKGMLAERGGIDPTTAFDRMRRYARAQRRGLHEVAQDVVHGTAADDVLTCAGPTRTESPG